jgi:hypothetical protein
MTTSHLKIIFKYLKPRFQSFSAYFSLKKKSTICNYYTKLLLMYIFIIFYLMLFLNYHTLVLWGNFFIIIPCMGSVAWTNSHLHYISILPLPLFQQSLVGFIMLSPYLCMYACMYVYICTHIYIYTYLYINLYNLYYFQHTSCYNLLEGVGNENFDLINFGNRDFRIYNQKNCTIIVENIISHKVISWKFWSHCNKMLGMNK